MFDRNYPADHAVFRVGKNYDSGDIKTKQFTASIDSALFINAGYDTQQKIDDAMKKIAKYIIKFRLKATEKNGVRVKKDGSKVQKYRERKVYFSELSVYYHNRHPDATMAVNPHFHIIFPAKMKLGGKYAYLRFGLAKIATKYGLKFHFMENKTYSGLSKKQEYFLRNIIMQMQRNDQYIAKIKQIKQLIALVEKHYKNTGNIAYFTKQINTIHNYMSQHGIDLIHNGVNLKNEMFMYLSYSQVNKIDMIKNGNIVELDLINTFDREVLKGSNGFKTEVNRAISLIFDIDKYMWIKMRYTIVNKSKDRKKKYGHGRYSLYRFSVIELLRINYNPDIFHSVAKPIMHDYIKKYSQLYNITVFESGDVTIAMYPDAIILKEADSIDKAIQDMSNFFPTEKYHKMDIQLSGEARCIRRFEKYLERQDSQSISNEKPKKKKQRMMSM